MFLLYPRDNGSVDDASWWGAGPLLVSIRYVVSLTAPVVHWLTIIGLHFLPEYRRCFQTDYSHEVGTSAVRHVDSRGVTW